MVSSRAVTGLGPFGPLQSSGNVEARVTAVIVAPSRRRGAENQATARRFDRAAGTPSSSWSLDNSRSRDWRYASA